MKTKLLLPLFCFALFASCNDGKVDSQQISQIDNSSKVVCSKCPAFKSGQDTLEFVNELRIFLAEKCDLGLMTHLISENYSEYPIGEFPADSFLDLFEADSLAVSVGMITRIMQQVLTENGIDSYVYKFGFDVNKHSHCVILVKFNGEYVVVDPYFNYTLYTESGEPLGITALIELIGQSTSEKIQIRSASVSTDFLFNESQASEGHRGMIENKNCRELKDSFEEIREGVLKTTINRCYQCDLDNDCTRIIRRFEDQLTKKTQLNSFLEAFVLKLEAVWGAKDALELDDKIETAIYSQPNLGKRVRKPNSQN